MAQFRETIHCKLHYANLCRLAPPSLSVLWFKSNNRRQKQRPKRRPFKARKEQKMAFTPFSLLPLLISPTLLLQNNDFQGWISMRPAHTNRSLDREGYQICYCRCEHRGKVLSSEQSNWWISNSSSDTARVSVFTEKKDYVRIHWSRADEWAGALRFGFFSRVHNNQEPSDIEEHFRTLKQIRYFAHPTSFSP